jgi:hypothetical protein
MATYHEVPRPERPRGTEAERWDQVYRYLYKLAEHLENIINNMTKEGAQNNGDHAERQSGL